ncbi:Cys/Met metabolism pyridoxal-phosphate-dependent enzyme [Acidothermus cellulolyticus 11B]|jgi:cystathionine gamma-lyase|uniref:Cys/Met metabolism pyridoxal-phosphate-dependent enzyme n=1 Tax=Acidothermus cellulolyticus (strain ATCC 43068 / DSM 8971 / 11B) TaxID=351607 RepID=A0LUT7_ACIC1|nr:cystathionine gamma-lyase [Acidothermus cellulolyticus]ABK53197.1 Cys/Met metabolism pyridoxal-phosphate-dependent enzyme [Acidothermus cellulolyticus 11B]MBX5447514.1 cystathionine gamma-lyase [Acidothermus cellulolyticus]MCL6550473.1 cystathionine gamma-lyase [Acidothermus cellulolyticus]
MNDAGTPRHPEQSDPRCQSAEPADTGRSGATPIVSGDGTRVLTAGGMPGGQGTPLVPSPVFASTYVLHGEPAGPYQYGRLTNPTWTAWEAALADLEGGPAIAFASGIAAVTAVLATTLRPGDTMLMASDCYYATRRLAEEFLSDFGVVTRWAPTGPEMAAQVAGARLVWIESPSNPGLDVCDIAELARRCRDEGALLAVDNTTATPLGQQPLLLGADFSVASDTKAMTGHSDIVLGHVACRTGELAERIRGWRNSTGAIPGPFETWLAHRSLATLDLRLARQADNARELAAMLAAHPAVRRVRYPWLPSDPAYPLAVRQMRRPGGLVSFELAGAAEAEAFLGALRLVTVATSFGGVHSTAERRARWGGDDVPPGFIRFSCGCEDAADLLADVEQALARLR